MGHSPAVVTAATAVLRAGPVMDGVPGGTKDQRSFEKRYLPQAHVLTPPVSSGQKGSTGGGHGAHPHLHNDSEEHHHDGRCHKVVLGFHLCPVQQDDQGKGHGSAEATIRHDHLVDPVQGDEAEAVEHAGLEDNT